MTTPAPEPASRRDPSNRVVYDRARVLRLLDAAAAADWAAFSTTGLAQRAQADGRLVPTTTLAEPVAESAEPQWSATLEHERVPFISYPYEWTTGMLRDAAILQLELLGEALAEGFTLKDGSAYNVQFRGAVPQFIDTGSFTRHHGGPWPGYREFCQTCLYPLMLATYRGVPFQPFLRGSLDGIPPSTMRRLLGPRDRLRKAALQHVILHGAAEARFTDGSKAATQTLDQAGFGLELSKKVAANLLRTVTGLPEREASSGWSGYRDDCTYTAADDAAKKEFVERHLAADRPNLVWDLGCNDGAYARIAAESSHYVVAMDADEAVVDRLYRSLRADGERRILPLVVDLTNPSPDLGWQHRDRRSLPARGRPDVALALALVHHLVIAATVPLDDVVSWLHGLADRVIVEFPDRHDVQVRRLLANSPGREHEDYSVERFEALIASRFTVDDRATLPSGTRTLYALRPVG